MATVQEDTTDDEGDVRINIVLDDPRTEGYLVKTLAAGDGEEVEEFLSKGKNGFEPGRYQEALRAVHKAWGRESKEE